MPIMRKASSVLAAVTLLVLSGVAAGASTPSAKPLAKELLSASSAKKAGFSAVAEKASTSNKTGVKSCPDGAQEAFEDKAAGSGLISEILECSSSKGAAALLKGARAQGSASGTPPKQLGSAVAERRNPGPVYALYWQHGDLFEFVGLETHINFSSTSSTTTTIPAPPITAAQQKVLTNAALAQLAQAR